MWQPVDILVVEDYEPDAHLLRLLLKRNHILNQVHVITDGSSALDFLLARGNYATRAGEPLPGVAIVDIRLPNMDGWELLRQIRQNDRTRDLPVILVSGSLLENEAEKARELGASGCLAKPVKIEGLRQLLTNCGLYWSISDPQPA